MRKKGDWNAGISMLKVLSQPEDKKPVSECKKLPSNTLCSGKGQNSGLLKAYLSHTVVYSMKPLSQQTAA